MADLPRISIPLSQRWRWIRFQLLPFILFVVAISLTGWLWTRFLGSTNGVGEVYATRVEIISRGEGLLVELDHKLEVFEHVKAGDLLARLDDKVVKAQLAVLQNEMAGFEKEIGKVEETARLQDADRNEKEDIETRRLAIAVEKLRLEEIQLRVTINVDEANLRDLKDLVKTVTAGGAAVSMIDKIKARTEQNLVEKRIAENSKAIELIGELIKKSQERQAEFNGVAKANADLLTAPARQAVNTAKAKIDAIQVQINALEIRSPIDGIIAVVLKRPNQEVKLGDPLLTIASEEASFVVSYIRQGRNVMPQPNMALDVKPRRIPVQSFHSYIAEVGAQVEQVPLHHQRDPRIIEWGLPVKIPIPPELKTLRPGELVDIRFIPYASSSPADLFHTTGNPGKEHPKSAPAGAAGTAAPGSVAGSPANTAHEQSPAEPQESSSVLSAQGKPQSPQAPSHVR